MPLSKFESMLKTNNVYFFDATEFESIVQYYLDIGKHSLARKALVLGVKQHPTSIPLKLLQVELLTFECKVDKAIALLKEIEAVEPHNDEVFFQKANILSKENKHREAIEVLEESLNYVEDKVDVWAIIGMEYMYLDEYEKARVNFEKCVDADLDDYSSLYNIIYCFEATKQYEQAVSFLKSYIDINPYCEVAWQQLGRQYFTLNNYEKALEAFDYAIIVDEHFIGGYLEKAKTLEKLNRYEDAVQNYLMTIELDDPTAFAYIRIGECFEKLNEFDTAIKYYEKAVHEDPLHEKGWLLLTDIYHNQGNYTKALDYIKKAMHIDDLNPVYWEKYACINLKLDSSEEAVKALQTSIGLGGDAIGIYIALVDVLLFLGDFDDALGVLVKAKKIYKESAEIEYRLSVVFLLLNQRDFGLIHLKNGLAIDFDYHKIIQELFPSVYDREDIRLYIEEGR